MESLLIGLEYGHYSEEPGSADATPSPESLVQNNNPSSEVIISHQSKRKKISEVASTNCSLKPLPQQTTKPRPKKQLQPKHEFVVEPLSSQEEETNKYLTPEEKSLKRRLDNKEAARKSRNKKKERLDYLEKRAVELELELQTQRNELKKAQQSLENFASSNTLTSSLTIGKKLAFDRLQVLVENGPHIDEDEVNLILDNLKYRVGAGGKQRQSTVNYCLKQISHLCFPALHRYLMYTAQANLDVFAEQGFEQHKQWTNFLSESLGLNESQKEHIKQSQEAFKFHKSVMSQYIDQLHEIQHNIEQQGLVLQEYIQSLRKFLSPLQCALIGLMVERNKFKQEMYLWSKNNIRKFSEEMPAIVDDFKKDEVVKKEEEVSEGIYANIPGGKKLKTQ